MMNFVTGGTGIVGIRLLFDLLKDNQEVRALRRKTSNLSVVKDVFRFYDEEYGMNLFDKIEWVEGDVLDVLELEEAMTGCDMVYHCAAVVSFHSKDFDVMYEVNQRGTENVVNVAIDLGVKKLCHISSVAAIGREKEGRKIDEKSEWVRSKYNSYYAVTKFSSEQEVWRSAEEGVDVVILNPGIIFGAGTKGKSSSSIFTAVKKGLRFYTKGSGSFVDVRDVSRIALKAMNNYALTRERYILVSENRSLKSVFDLIAESLGKPKPSILAGKLLLSMGWRLFYLKDYLLGTKSDLTKESARSAQSTFEFINSKAKREFDIPFISVKDSISYFSSFYQ